MSPQMPIFLKNVCGGDEMFSLMYNMEIQINVRCLNRDAGPRFSLDPNVPVPLLLCHSFSIKYSISTQRSYSINISA